MKIPILMYHSISPDINKLTVSEKNFELQMRFLSNNNYKSICFDDLDFLDKKSKYFIITFDDGYENVFKYALPILKKYKFTSTCFFVTKYIGKHNDWDEKNIYYYKQKIMSLEQILTWHNSGMSVGAHTENHKNLSEIDNEQKKSEILNSIEYFKSKLSLNIKYFSYPFGRYDDQTLDLIKKNFKFAVTTKRSRFISGKFKYYELPRIPVNNNTSLFKFYLKIKTPYEDFKYKK